MEVFVTGGTGYLGRHLIPALESQGHRCTAPSSRELDLTQEGSLSRFDAGTFDMVFHLAAWTRAGTFCRTRGGSQWLVNQRLNTNVLAWWKETQPRSKLIAFGTSVSYPKGVALKESNYLSGLPIEDFYAYAMTKRMLLVGLQSLAKEFGLKYAYFVPSTLYGPNYHVDGRPMHFIYDLIRKIIRGRELCEEVILWGDGNQRRELVYIDDFVDWLLMLTPRIENDVINLGEGTEHSIREFAQIICEVIGFPFERIRFDTSKYVGLTSKVLDVSAAHRLAPDLRRTSLREGLMRTIAWMLDSKLYLAAQADW